jgi:hypothetical protein
MYTTRLLPPCVSPPKISYQKCLYYIYALRLENPKKKLSHTYTSDTGSLHYIWLTTKIHPIYLHTRSPTPSRGSRALTPMTPLKGVNYKGTTCPWLHPWWPPTSTFRDCHWASLHNHYPRSPIPWPQGHPTWPHPWDSLGTLVRMSHNIWTSLVFLLGTHCTHCIGFTPPFFPRYMTFAKVTRPSHPWNLRLFFTQTRQRANLHYFSTRSQTLWPPTPSAKLRNLGHFCLLDQSENSFIGKGSRFSICLPMLRSQIRTYMASLEPSSELHL